MSLFDVYPQYNVTPTVGKGLYVLDENNKSYLDFYGGHAVISIGHGHPHYVKSVSDQLAKLPFYSNALQNPLQVELGKRLSKLAGGKYALFCCNSGAEANENALKIASFHTNRSKILAFNGAFHGRTSAAVAVTDNPKIQAPINGGHLVTFIQGESLELLYEELSSKSYAAVIIEGIQGVSGVRAFTLAFWKQLATWCKEFGTLLIVDEVQSGVGRTGHFFAHHHYGIRPDMVTMAKGLGNGFPIGAVLVDQKLPAWHGMLGSTFGGNQLGCRAALAVLDVIEKESLMDNAARMGRYLRGKLQEIDEIEEVRGLGLMLGIEVPKQAKALQKELLDRQHILVGISGDSTIRLLPPLTIHYEIVDRFLKKLKEAIVAINVKEEVLC